jgi:hypothetical protein
VVRTPTNYQKKGVLPLDFRQQDCKIRTWCPRGAG